LGALADLHRCDLAIEPQCPCVRQRGGSDADHRRYAGIVKVILNGRVLDPAQLAANTAR